MCYYPQFMRILKDNIYQYNDEKMKFLKKAFKRITFFRDKMSRRIIQELIFNMEVE